MKLSARKQIRGKKAEMKLGKSTAHSASKSVYAVIKASDVTVGVD